MIDFKKIIVFLIANGAGCALTPFILTVALKFGVFPQPVSGDSPKMLEYAVTNGMWLWLLGALVSIGYFFAERKKTSRIFVLAPLYLPFLYNAVTLIYLNLR